MQAGGKIEIFEAFYYNLNLVINCTLTRILLIMYIMTVVNM